MGKYSALKHFGIGRKLKDNIVERVLTNLVSNKYIKNIVVRNQFGFYNDKLKVYNKSKEILNNDTKITLPFLDKTATKEYYVIKPKKRKIQELNVNDIIV